MAELVLLLAALIVFIIASVPGVATRINLIAVGLALLTASLLVAGWPFTT